ncbi:DUF4139 domain-containing protein [Pseudomarimonas salicorniae]|uniref:DUF4139 domain-containing protein n=1 Tax=Pseudomarimonas salicorniae TaxID=2933270 RepID=A0ABT0GKV7_9GAMM|nr:hypothetical protein [Lysobacter sp. CAU 1642]MCK7595178.1 hypothetical protein [Lysobacter sp. CAU 1642]
MRRTLLALAIVAPLAAQAEADYSLTVYSSAQPGQIDTERLAQYGDRLPGYALVRDARSMRLERGASTLRFTDVAARIDPTTVSFASKTDPEGTRVVEQAYQYDLVSSARLLQRFIGETISVDQPVGDGHERISGTLLSADGGLTLALPGGEIATLNSWSGVRFPSLPGGLITRPTLVWTLDARRGGEHEVQVAYQANGLTWWSDYNVTLDETQGCRMDLGAWVTLVNQSGGSFPNARLKLVAGEVNRAPVPAPPAMMARREMVAMDAMADEGFTESGLFEYHLYTLGRRTDLPDNATKQIELFPTARGVRCSKQLVFTAAPQMNAYYGGPQLDQGYAATSQGEVGAFIEFENREDNGLGMALPAGRVRVNQASGSDGSLEFIGEDMIGHTPRNEKLSLKLGKAFDVVGERRQVDFRVDTEARWLEESFEVSVRNRKEEPVEVRVREYAYRWSQWTLKSQSHPSDKRDAQTFDFPLKIPADGEVKLRYTIRYTW